MLPEANCLVLIGQMDAVTTVEVICLSHASGGTIKVLCATLWCQISEVAGILGNLQKKESHENI